MPRERGSLGAHLLLVIGNSMAEPDWSKLRFDQLVAAEKMARHRLSGGESSWQPILDRIRAAKRHAG